MENNIPQQRQGWLSWLRESVWGVSQPEPESFLEGGVPGEGGRLDPGMFSPPFLRGTTSCQKQHAAAPISSSSSGGGGSRSSNRNRGSSAHATRKLPSNRKRRNGGDADGYGGVNDGAAETELKRYLPLIWQYLREEEGWSFVNSHSWDVQGPAVGAVGVVSSADSGGRSESVQHESGRMPQGQVSCRVLTV